MNGPWRPLIATAAAFLALGGLLAGLVTVAIMWGVISSALAGCLLVIAGNQIRVPVVADPLGCTQYVDGLAIVLGCIAAGALLGALAWLLHPRAGWLSRVVPIGAAAALLIGIYPLIVLASLADDGFVALGPIELGLGAVLLGWGLIAAAVLVAAWAKHRRAATRNPTGRDRPGHGAS